jgi:tRNA threonylcarbamoyl adenosine modification protein YjeE
VDGVRTLTLADEAATSAFAERLAAVLRPGDLVLLEGELGAGKTFLARSLCRALGVPEAIPVTSPTFGLVHEYQGRVPIVHADLYRLSDPDELVELGLEEQIGGEAVVLVEWGERFLTELGPATLLIRMEIAGETSREVRIEADGGRLSGVVSTL